MFKKQCLNRREAIKTLLYVSAFSVFPVSQSCKSGLVDDETNETASKLNRAMKKIRHFQSTPLPDGTCKVPDRFIYSPVNDVHIVMIRKEEENGLRLEMISVKMVSQENSDIILEGVPVNAILVEQPAQTIRYLDKIDHDELKKRFIKKN